MGAQRPGSHSADFTLVIITLPRFARPTPPPLRPSVGVLYANYAIVWDPLPKSLGLAALLVIVPIFAFIGNVAFQRIALRYSLSAKRIILINLTAMSLVPAYGLLGYADATLGYRRWWELFVGVAWYGLHLGSVQSFSRSLYSTTLPEGKEAQLFSLFAFTDRSSSWIGPAIVASVLQATGSIRLAFVYPVVVLLVPAILLGLLVDPSKAADDARAFTLRFGAGGAKGRGALSLATESREETLSLG